MKKVLIIDNYDSFTYNLVHYVEEVLGYEIEVWRNDHIDYEALEKFEYIILSPGPGIPDEAGDLKKVIAQVSGSKKLLGVCLGHQAIGEVFGGQLENLSKVYHGVQTDILQTSTHSLFEGIDKAFSAGRYHSWVIRKGSLGDEFEITSTDDKGEIMSFRHKKLAIHGVQFHPESILTPDGKQMLTNFLNL